MKVLMTYHGLYDPDSGACGSMIRIGKALVELGVSVDFLTYSDLPSLGSTPNNHARFPFLVKESMDQKSYDLLDACTGDSWWYSFRRSARSVPVVIRSSGLEHMYFGERRRAGESWRFTLYWRMWVLRTVRYGIQKASHYFALTLNERNYVQQRFGLEDSRLSIEPHVPSKEYLSASVDCLPRKPLKCIWVGRCTIGKGSQTLLDAVSRLNVSDEALEFHFVGTGLGEQELLQHFPESFRNKVRWYPKATNQDLIRLYSSCHVFIFPSMFEGFGKVLAEAMCCGCTPITTNVGCVQDLVVDGQNGLIIEQGDSNALAEGISEFLKGTLELDRFRMNARRSAEDFFSNQSYSKRIEVYRKVLQR